MALANPPDDQLGDGEPAAKLPAWETTPPTATHLIWRLDDADALLLGVPEELGEAAGGLMGILGGIGIFGCGICSLVLGGILALTLKDPQPPTQMM